MINKSIAFAKLAGEYKNIKSLLDQKIGKAFYQNYDPETVQLIFRNYTNIVASLKKSFAQLYADIPERKIPEPTPGNSIHRSALETIKRDIEYVFELNAQYSAAESKSKETPDRIFISHGSSKDWMIVQNYIERDLEIKTLELAQEPNKGRTVLQKLNEESENCSYAVVVMTGDDIISDGEIRARENVMHEIGYFQGKYGFDKVCLLHEEGTNIPSNIAGLVYIPFPKENINATLGTLSRELRVYFNKAI